MKASSLLRHIWVGCFICALFLFTTGVAYANGTSRTVDDGPKKEIKVEQVEPGKKKTDAVPAKDPVAPKTEPKPAEVKKEGNTSGFVSFNFLYYLFYKTNFAETTNRVLQNSWNSFINSLLN